MDNSLLLLGTILLPLLGAGLMWVLAPLGRNAVRWGALGVTLATLAGAGVLVSRFPADGNVGSEGFAVFDTAWIETAGFSVHFSVGLDGIGLWMFALSALLLVTAVLVSWEAINDREPLFYGMLLLLECGCLGVFTARDLLLFYVFFEFTLIPLFFLIGIWGSEDRRFAAAKFFLYTLAGSVLTFLGLLALVFWSAKLNNSGMLDFSIGNLTQTLQALQSQGPEKRDVPFQILIFGMLFAGFAIKVPLFPLHTWLPLAHVQAPTAGSVILAGVLLKIGTYGFLRFSIPLLPDATAAAMPCLLWISVIGILYGALVALAQSDIKRLIAYSSVSHLGFVMLGLFALNPLGLEGGTLQMVNHGLSTGGLFALVGMVYERYHTREIGKLGGLARRTPLLATFMVLFTFSSIGLPGMNGFAGEFLLLLGMFQRAWAESPPLIAGQFLAIAVLAVLGVVLGAWYMLWLVQRVFFGPLKEPHEGHGGQAHAEVRDLSLREVAALVPLLVFVLWIGLAPRYFLDRMEPTLNKTLNEVSTAVERRFKEKYEPKEDTARATDGAETEKLSRVR